MTTAPASPTMPHASRWRWPARLLLCLLAMVIGLAVGFGGRNQLASPPLAHASATLPGQVLLSTGPAAAVPPLSTGGALVTDSDSGTIYSRNADTVIPTASIAKTMTALAVLAAWPLQPGQAGRTITVTAADVATLQQVLAEGGSYAPVELGEHLTERDMLVGMMLPSANNYAIMLSQRVGGTEAAFVTRLNAMAMALGMTHTHFVDPDGLDSGTTSTPADLLILGRAAIANPTLLWVMAQSQWKLPDGSVITNIDSLVGSFPGWLGIKTGHTNAAGYCLLFAAREPLFAGSPPLTVVGVVMGQTTRAATFAFARRAVADDVAAYRSLAVAQLRPVFSGSVTTAWGVSAALQLLSAPPQQRAVRTGITLVVEYQLVLPDVTAAASGSRIGSVVASAGGVVIGRWAVVLGGSVAAPSELWRLVHG